LTNIQIAIVPDGSVHLLDIVDVTDHHRD